MARVESDTDENSDNDVEAVILSVNNTEASDDDLSSSSDEEDENELEQKAAELEEKVKTNPYVYDEHVNLLNVLHKIKNKTRLRHAYERLYCLCPMSPAQWSSWLEFEGQNLSTQEDRLRLKSLFEKAFLDCYSANMYVEWCTLNLSNGEDEEDIQIIFEEAIRAAGSDLADGALLWDTIREYELAILSRADSSSDDLKPQVMKVFEIFRKELSLPLIHIEDIYPGFKYFMSIMDIYIPDSDIMKQEVEDAHIRSKTLLQQLLEYECTVKDSGEETEEILKKSEMYQNYISYVKDLLDDKTLKNCNIENFLGVLYDRATSECITPFYRGKSALPENAEKLCIEYIDYAREFGSDVYCLQIIGKVIRRYQRNSTLWILKLQHLERMGKEFEEIKTEFESALVGGFDTADNYVSLWLCYLEILRRKTDFDSAKQIEVLRKTFRLSWDSLSEIWGDEADKEFVILQYWARIEYYRTKDYDYGEELFKEIMDYGDNKLRGGLWLEYMRLEFYRGGENRARTILKNAVKNSSDPRLQYTWLALERDFGTLDSLIECNKMCAVKAKEWSEIQSKNKTNAYGKFQHKQYSGKNQNNDDDAYKKGKNKRKQKPNPNENGSKKVLKTHHDELPSSSKYTETVVENKYGNKKQAVNNEPKPNLKRKHDSNTDAYETQEKKSKDDQYSRSDSNETFSLQNDPEKINRTIFISNLDFKVDESNLRDKLSEYGVIEELRLVTGVKSFGGSICYCIYLDNKSVEKALSHDRSLFNDRPMFISRYTEKGDRKKHFSYSTGIERNKLFVKNIPFEHCKEGALREIFEKYGKLKDVRIVTHKTGKPKGLAYIEFSTNQEASNALTAVDGLDLDGRNLSVAISAPPPKTTPLSETPLNQTRTHARTKLFLPSVLQTASSANKNKQINESKTTNESSQSKLSNSDFRNMLLGNK